MRELLQRLPQPPAQWEQPGPCTSRARPCWCPEPALRAAVASRGAAAHPAQGALRACIAVLAAAGHDRCTGRPRLPCAFYPVPFLILVLVPFVTLTLNLALVPFIIPTWLPAARRGLLALPAAGSSKQGHAVASQQEVMAVALQQPQWAALGCHQLQQHLPALGGGAGQAAPRGRPRRPDLVEVLALVCEGSRHRQARPGDADTSASRFGQWPCRCR
ncbi:uncharacterized protein LOC113940201 [Corapipo altera]|uniref:uncharacterized protein LOC113940201 n=1 Tax=Corapipo altera TaxID=415028 RepID=UPI000FD64243|nr:uncharacterized protein LOC113940201 [Corapipo altera]